MDYKKMRQIAFLVFPYFLYHIYTLSSTPTPWFDENLFISITEALLNKGRFDLDVAPYFPYAKNYFLYGPVYFLFTSLSIKIFGFGIFQFRLPALLFGLLLLPLFYKILKNYFNNRNIALTGTMLLMFDPVFNTNMHEGRMDTMALFFLLSSVYLWMRFLAVSIKKHSLLVLSGVFVGLAILTSPRTLFIAVLIPVSLFGHYLKREAIKSFFFDVAIGSIVPALALMGWIYFAFGSFYNYLLYYQKFNAVFSSFTLDLHQWIFPFNYPLIFLTLLTSTSVALKKALKGTFLNCLALMSIVVFHFFIKGGFYIIFVLPFYYLIFIEAIQFFKEKPAVFKGILFAILTFNIGIFIIRAGVNLIQPPDYSGIEKMIAASIPKKARVIGDEKFYYAIKKNGSDFQSINFWWLTNTLQREAYQRKIYDYQYIVCETKPNHGALPVYMKNSKLDTLAVYHDSNSNQLIESIRVRLSPFFTFNRKNQDFIILKRTNSLGL